MEKKLKTYTYTARNVSDPRKVVTFTLSNGHMRINLTGLFDHAMAVSESDEKTEETKRQFVTQAKPAVLKLREAISGPVHVSDVNTALNGDQLNVHIWPRVGGLRLAPVYFNMGHVDNQTAAEAFVEELEKRKDSESDMRKFLGPLDYWFGWAGLALVIALFIRRPKRNDSQTLD